MNNEEIFYQLKNRDGLSPIIGLPLVIIICIIGYSIKGQPISHGVGVGIFVAMCMGIMYGVMSLFLSPISKGGIRLNHSGISFIDENDLTEKISWGEIENLSINKERKIIKFKSSDSKSNFFITPDDYYKSEELLNDFYRFYNESKTFL